MTSWTGIDDDQWVIDQWKGSGATGAYNAYFAALADNLVAAGMGDSVLRIGWEFNQSTYPWYAAGQPTNFVNYWRQVVTTMRSVQGANFSFEWNPSRGDNGPKDAAMGNFAAYYPGDSYVDIVGMDVYDGSWGTYPGLRPSFKRSLPKPGALIGLRALGQPTTNRSPFQRWVWDQALRLREYSKWSKSTGCERTSPGSRRDYRWFVTDRGLTRTTLESRLGKAATRPHERSRHHYAQPPWLPIVGALPAVPSLRRASISVR